MTRLAAIAADAAREGLAIAGIAPVTGEDRLAPGLSSIILLAPDEPVFWPHFRTAPELQDGAPDALDRWSRRVIGQLACSLSAKAYFPFGRPPHRPFIAWALRSGRAHTSPTGLLVHCDSGLFLSLRGAIALSDTIAPDPAPRPCDTCAGQPCRSACPAAALTAAGYDLRACHSFLDTTAGSDCMEAGCLVRRACPIGRDRRLPAQSAFHMKAFHP